MTLSANLGCNPFVIMDQDADEVIMTINFYIMLGGSKIEDLPVKANKEKRIRVNDKTATGGWF